MIRSAFLILSGNMVRSLMLFIRNLLIARLVDVEDYGIAATFAITMAVVEMTSELGLRQLIVQNKGGDDPHMQASLQGFNVLRGFVSGLFMFLIAAPLAAFLGVPEIAWAYQLLALIPIVRSFEHFDIYRFNRAMSFRPMVVSRTLPAVFALASVWPLYHLYGDYRIMLYSILLQWALVVLFSHMVAERPFRIAFDRAIMRMSLKFGWPLLANGVLIFFILQGDKLIVGREMGMATLGVFAMGVTLTLTPALVLSGSLQQFLLPQLSAQQDNDAKFLALGATALQASLLIGTLFTAFVVLAAPYAVHILLGPKYAALLPLLTWFSVQQSIRIFKMSSATIALAKAQTHNAMIANLIRVSVLPGVWYLAARGSSLETIIWLAVLGEFCSYIVSLIILPVARDQLWTRLWKPLCASAASMSIIAALHRMQATEIVPTPALILACIILPLMCLLTMHDLRQFLKLRKKS